MEYDINKVGKPVKIYNMQFFNVDCMDLLRETPDKYYELAIVDPPYGLGGKTTKGGCKKNSLVKFPEHKWDDEIPSNKYFDELFRVSKNQIIWGGNYFPLSKYRTFIVWDKMTYVPTMSQIEMAYTSFSSPARLVKINSTQLDRQHPTQKPVALYKWLLKNYAKEGDKILDTHLGSMSIAIAIHQMNTESNMKLTLTGTELDVEYFKAGCERVYNQTRQNSLFGANSHPLKENLPQCGKDDIKTEDSSNHLLF